MRMEGSRCRGDQSGRDRRGKQGGVGGQGGRGDTPDEGSREGDLEAKVRQGPRGGKRSQGLGKGSWCRGGGGRPGPNRGAEGSRSTRAATLPPPLMLPVLRFQCSLLPIREGKERGRRKRRATEGGAERLGPKRRAKGSRSTRVARCHRCRHHCRCCYRRYRTVAAHRCDRGRRRERKREEGRRGAVGWGEGEG